MEVRGRVIRRPVASVRPQIQREFLRWLQEFDHAMGIDVRVTRRTDRWLKMVFVGINPVISAVLTRTGISVTVDIDGLCWDLIFDDDVVPVRVTDGFVCKLCAAESQKVYPSRAALWRDHLFEPFLLWINEKLLPSRTLWLGGSRGGSTWATLSADFSDPQKSDAHSTFLVVHQAGALCDALISHSESDGDRQ
jgi:hypothetical protein